MYVKLKHWSHYLDPKIGAFVPIDPLALAAIDPPSSEVAEFEFGEMFEEQCRHLCDLIDRVCPPINYCLFLTHEAPANDDVIAAAEQKIGEYYVRRGTLYSACEQSIFPTKWWPDTRAWYVSTLLDSTFSLIGCDAVLANALVSETLWDASYVAFNVPVTSSDDANE